ncbi:hypothetical protein AVEN_90697-1 [Araneus ventricosus]|uniref:Uncharacterized protein n=1 Tax=Araneus ventricosus TaxID=182803 RepID=A0A4Y2KRS8_ARAVE|nr:hypothetical protein AVEN_90697-1 [Araneus ventricosus]
MGRGTILKKSDYHGAPVVCQCTLGPFSTSSNRPAKNVRTEAHDPLFRRPNPARRQLKNFQRSSLRRMRRAGTCDCALSPPRSSPNKLFREALGAVPLILLRQKRREKVRAKFFTAQSCRSEPLPVVWRRDQRTRRVANGREQ